MSAGQLATGCSHRGCRRTTTHASLACFDHRRPARPTLAPLLAPPPPAPAVSAGAQERVVDMPAWTFPRKSDVKKLAPEVAKMLPMDYRGEARGTFDVQSFVSCVRAMGAEAVVRPVLRAEDEAGWAALTVGVYDDDPVDAATNGRLPPDSLREVMAGGWAGMGFGPTEAAGWEGADVQSSSVARVMADRGWTPERWALVGKSSRSRVQADWVIANLDAEDAALAAGADSDPAASAAMLDHGWSPKDVGALRGAGANVEDSRLAAGAGLSAEAAVGALREGVPLSWAAAGL